MRQILIFVLLAAMASAASAECLATAAPSSAPRYYEPCDEVCCNCPAGSRVWWDCPANSVTSAKMEELRANYRCELYPSAAAELTDAEELAVLSHPCVDTCLFMVAAAGLEVGSCCFVFETEAERVVGCQEQTPGVFPALYSNALVQCRPKEVAGAMEWAPISLW